MIKNIGVGVDIEDIERFKETSDSFLKKIFTENELKYCFSKANSAQHLAARFAGKEAVIKALGNLGEKEVIDYGKIVIVNNNLGVPLVNIADSLFSIKISLSHCKDKAMAFALVIKNEKI